MHNICPVTLYHGTSSIFLPSILKNGLGGINAVKEWGILELAREIFPYVEENFKDDYRFYTFKKMVNQEILSNGQNFQHGDVYLSASQTVAVKYTADRELGSELLTRTLEFLQMLIDLDCKTVISDLYKKYKPLYNFLRVHAAPLLVEIQNLDYEDLLNEDGSIVDLKTKEYIEKIALDYPERTYNRDEMLQLNFRLKKVVKKENLKISLIGVKKIGNFELDYDLYPLNV